jgi:metal-dependent amidase/aminoacylase/carboxypeptidase family protein
LINAGAFEDIDIAMMAHPFPDNDVLPIALSRETYANDIFVYF